MKKVIAVFILFLISVNCISETGEVSGNVIKIVNHQYLDGIGWDNQIWFCLDSQSSVGSCPTSSSCNNKAVFVISKDAAPSIFSTVLAAKLSNTQITVGVDDSKRLMGLCVARIISI